MTDFEPSDVHFEFRVRSSFDQQGIMKTIGAKLTKVIPGEVHIEVPFSMALTQQHGYIHAGIITTVVDTACGYAANTLMPVLSEVLTVEYKINFLSPGKGEKIIGIGKVVKPGRTLTVCSGEVRACDKNDEKLIATMQATMMAVVK